MKNGRKQKIIFRFYLVLIFLPCLEIALRITGYKPFQQIPFSIESSPQFCILPDSHLGFALRPGTFEVKINEALSFRTTHGKDSLRITGFERPDTGLSRVFIMGCSYTYGMGVDDSLNFPFLIQKHFPRYRVRNFGVPGYGMVQSYLQLKRCIARGEMPDIVIINFADFHSDRISLTQQYRRDLHFGFERSNEMLKSFMIPARIPFLREDFPNGYVIETVEWSEVYRPLKWRENLAIVNLIQNFSDWNVSRKTDKMENTLQIFRMIRDVCQANDIRFWVTGLTKTEVTQEVLRRLGKINISTIDISVDLTDTTYNNLPFDAHPNAKAHSHFGNALIRLLEENDNFNNNININNNFNAHAEPNNSF